MCTGLRRVHSASSARQPCDTAKHRSSWNASNYRRRTLFRTPLNAAEPIQHGESPRMVAQNAAQCVQRRRRRANQNRRPPWRSVRALWCSGDRQNGRSERASENGQLPLVHCQMEKKEWKGTHYKFCKMNWAPIESALGEIISSRILPSSIIGLLYAIINK